MNENLNEVVNEKKLGKIRNFLRPTKGKVELLVGAVAIVAGSIGLAKLRKD